MNIVELFLQASKRYPEKIAIIERDNNISYCELKEEVVRTAAYFEKRGIRKGDRILVFVPMGIDLYRILMAIFYLGATAVFLDEWVSFKRLNLCCKLADCKGFIGVRKTVLLKIFSWEVRNIPIKLSMGKRDSGVDLVEMDSEDTALISFTTGSTGTPKAAKRSHGFLLEQFKALEIEISPRPDDIDMSTLPIVLFINLGIGSTSVIADFKMSRPDKMDSKKIIKQFEFNRVNRLIASPYFVRRLSDFLLSNPPHDLKLDKIFTGGAPVFPDDARLFRKAFPNSDIRLVYGSTEAEPIASVTADELSLVRESYFKGLLVGNVFEQIQLKIIAISDSEIEKQTERGLSDMEMEEGEIGEIIVAGPHVLKSYFNNREAFRRNKIVTDNQVWHRTGDAGFVKGGKLYLVGRCSELVSNNNEYVSLFMVEYQIRSTKGVKVGTVIKVDEELILVYEGEEKVEFLPGLKYDSVLRLKIPKDPRHFSKIDYSRLRQTLRKGTSGKSNKNNYI